MLWVVLFFGQRVGAQRVPWAWHGTCSGTLSLLEGGHGELEVAALDCCGLGLVPHLLVGPCVLFWRRGFCSRATQSWVGGGCGNTGVALASFFPRCGVPVCCLADASFTTVFKGKYDERN